MHCHLVSSNGPGSRAQGSNDDRGWEAGLEIVRQRASTVFPLTTACKRTIVGSCGEYEHPQHLKEKPAKLSSALPVVHSYAAPAFQ